MSPERVYVVQQTTLTSQNESGECLKEWIMLKLFQEMNSMYFRISETVQYSFRLALEF